MTSFLKFYIIGKTIYRKIRNVFEGTPMEYISRKGGGEEMGGEGK
jgi:hypothetical protein